MMRITSSGQDLVVRVVYANHLPFVGRAVHRPAASIQDVRVDHRRPHVAVPEQLLNGPDVVAVLEQVRRKRMPESVKWPRAIRRPTAPPPPPPRRTPRRANRAT